MYCASDFEQGALVQSLMPDDWVPPPTPVLQAHNSNSPKVDVADVKGLETVPEDRNIPPPRSPRKSLLPTIFQESRKFSLNADSSKNTPNAVISEELEPLNAAKASSTWGWIPSMKREKSNNK